MLNSAIIMGRLTADPELRTTQSGLSVTYFTVAVDREFSGKEKKTDFLNCVAWRSTADFVTRYFKKGQMIAVQGSLQVRNYEDKNGNKRTAVEILADKVSFCGNKNENADMQRPSFTEIPDNTPQGDENYGYGTTEDDLEGLPF